MKIQTNLSRRKPSGIYYFRARVPTLLIPLIGKDVIFDSLKTKDKAKAVAEAAKRRHELQQELQRVQAIAPENLGIQKRLFISDEEVRAICERYLVHTLAFDDEYRFDGMSVMSSDVYGDILESHAAVITAAVVRGEISVIRVPLAAYLKAHVGIELDQSTQSYKKLAFEFLKTEAEATRARIARQRGEHVKTPSISVGRTSFEALIANWATQRAGKPNTRKEFEATFDGLLSIHPGLFVETTSKAHILQWRDALVKAGQAPGTIDKKLSYLSAAFSVAVEDDWIQTNPTKGVKAPAGPDKKPRVPFSNAELTAIFDSSIFRSGQRPKGGGGEAAYWLPLLALYTGARQEELAQLHIENLVQSKPLGWYLNISDEAEDAEVKNESSVRRVPLHCELLELGFLQYVEGLNGGPKTYIFPNLIPDVKGNRAGNFSKWFGRFKKKIGILDKRKVFHSFRHGFIDTCRDCLISTEIRDVIVGHSNQAVSMQYGADKYPLKPLFEAMERVQYSGLSLKHLRKSTAV